MEPGKRPPWYSEGHPKKIALALENAYYGQTALRISWNRGKLPAGGQMVGGGVALIGITLVPLLSGLFG